MGLYDYYLYIEKNLIGHYRAKNKTEMFKQAERYFSKEKLKELKRDLRSGKVKIERYIVKLNLDTNKEKNKTKKILKYLTNNKNKFIYYHENTERLSKRISYSIFKKEINRRTDNEEEWFTALLNEKEWNKKGLTKKTGVSWKDADIQHQYISFVNIDGTIMITEKNIKYLNI